jgi:hypothetical protein
VALLHEWEVGVVSVEAAPTFLGRTNLLCQADRLKIVEKA